MKIANSYNVKLTNINNSVIDTINIYRDAIAFLIDVYNKEWNDLEPLNLKHRINYAEKLIHKTKLNAPLYDFGKLFYKFPSYLRRSAISDALGIVSSYRSNLKNYEEEKYIAISNGKKFKKKSPKLNNRHFKCPVLYKNNMFLKDENDNYKAKIKIYKNNDWVWLNVSYRKSDVDYINRNCSNDKALSPILVRKNRNVYLKFTFSKDVKLTTAKLKDQIVMGVDLGLNHSAVCSVLNSNGTVKNRLFINQPVEKDRLNKMLVHLRNKKRNKNTKMPRVWAKINGLNTQITNDTVNKIVEFAISNKVDVIVFEYLDFKGKKPKQIAMRLNLWAKRTIQNKVTHKAHSNGIRISRVNAKNTSKLAFDGSGIVKRDKKNAKLCTFSTGKMYNNDLSASYNIASRYYIKKILFDISEKKYNLLLAKVPTIGLRTQCTLSTLLELNKAL